MQYLRGHISINALSNKANQQNTILQHQLTEHCKYGNIKEEMIQDRLVVGIRDKAICEC